jgi:xylulokinase
MRLLAGLDVGTTAVKAGVFDEQGRLLSLGIEQYALRHPTPDRAELDPEVWWTASRAALRAALGAPGVDPSAVEAIGVSSQGETVVPVDARGRAVGPALVWLDNRATAEARLLDDRIGTAEVYDATGVPTVIPTWTACKILWLRRHEPGVFASARRFLLVEDFAIHRLTGRCASEGGIQCTSLLYDIRSHAWWTPMLDAVGIGPDRLPDLIRPGEVAGELTADAAAELGLRPGIAVVACGMDQGAGAVGVGNVGPGIVSESTGAALTLQATVDRHGQDATRRTPVYVHSAADRYLYCPVSPTGGMALTWFRDRFGTEEVARAATDGTDPYDLLTALAAKVPAGAEGLTFLPHLMGAFSPEYEPDARAALYGLTLRHGKAHIVRAILESVAFMLRRNLELLDAAGARADEIRSHGGGAKSPLWNQIKADACDRPVVTLEGENAAIRGDALLAGVATGVFPDIEAAVAAAVTTRDRYAPDPRRRHAYETAYARYITFFDAVRPMFTPEPD